MKNNVTFRELRRLLLDLGFQERKEANAIVFDHGSSDILFVFRRYRLNDLVASYNLLDARMMLDSRGLMDAETFEEQFKKTPA